MLLPLSNSREALGINKMGILYTCNCIFWVAVVDFGIVIVVMIWAEMLFSNNVVMRYVAAHGFMD